MFSVRRIVSIINAVTASVPSRGRRAYRRWQRDLATLYTALWNARGGRQDVADRLARPVADYWIGN